MTKVCFTFQKRCTSSIRNFAY